jgi:hypothetical protein
MPETNIDNILAEAGLSIAEKVGNAAASAINTFLPTIMSRIAGAEGENAAKQAGEIAGKATEKFISILGNNAGSVLKLLTNIDIDDASFSNLRDKFNKNGLGGLIDGSPIEQALKVGLDLDQASTSTFKTALGKLWDAAGDTLGPLVEGDALLGIGAGALAQKIATEFRPLDSLAGKLEKLGVPIKSLNKTLVEYNKTALATVMPFSDMGMGAEASPVQSLENRIRQYQDARREVVMQTKGAVGGEEYDQLSRALKDAGISVSQMNAGLGETKTALGGIKGFSMKDAIYIKTALQLDDSSFAEFTRTLTKELGVVDNVGDRFGALRQAQKMTNMSTEEVRDVVLDSARTLKYFGDTTESVAANFTKMAKKLREEGKEGLAIDFQKNITRGIASLDNAKKAFLQAASGGGTGRGAFADILQFEQALRSKDPQKIERVMKSVTEQIEKLSGGPLMTIDEAVATGNEDRFIKSRELLKNFGFAGDDNSATEMINTFAKTGSLPMESLSAATGQQELLAEGEMASKAKTGLFGMEENIIKVNAELAATRSVASIFNKSVEGLANNTDMLNGVFKELVGLAELRGKFNDHRDGIDKTARETRLKSVTIGDANEYEKNPTARLSDRGVADELTRARAADGAKEEGIANTIRNNSIGQGDRALISQINNRMTGLEAATENLSRAAQHSSSQPLSGPTGIKAEISEASIERLIRATQSPIVINMEADFGDGVRQVVSKEIDSKMRKGIKDAASPRSR